MPAERRRRLINGVVRTIRGESSSDFFYSSVPLIASTGPSFRRRRSNKGGSSSDSRKPLSGYASGGGVESRLPLGFRPVDPSAEPRFRINVAKDGSMITAVPICEEERPSNSSLGGSFFQSEECTPRSSPILYSDARAFSHSGSGVFLKNSSKSNNNGDSSTASYSARSNQVLLDARGKQRSKMKLTRPGSKIKKAVKDTGSNTRKKHPDLSSPRHQNLIEHIDSDNSHEIHVKRGRLKRTKGLLPLTSRGYRGQIQSLAHNDVFLEELNNVNPKPPPKPPPSPKTPRNFGLEAHERLCRPTVRWDLPSSEHHDIGSVASYLSESLPRPMYLSLSQTTDLNGRKKFFTEETSNIIKSDTDQHGNLDDDSFGSFPILSSNHNFEDVGFVKESDEENDIKEGSTGEYMTDKSLEFFHFGESNPTSNHVTNLGTSKHGYEKYSFELLLRQRILEIESQKAALMQSILQKEKIEHTLVTAIDENLDKNRKKRLALDKELQIIRSHLKLLSGKESLRNGVKFCLKRKEPVDGSSNQKPKEESDKMEQIFDNREWDLYPSPSSDLVSIGDPSPIISDDNFTEGDSVIPVANESVTGIDPPAQPSPTRLEDEALPSIRRVTKEPVGSRISTVIRRNKVAGSFEGIRVGVGNRSILITKDNYSRGTTKSNSKSKLSSKLPTRPHPIRPNTLSLHPLFPSQNQQLQQQRKIHQHYNSKNEYKKRKEQKPNPLSASSINRVPLAKKAVHFTLPVDDDSIEVKIVPNYSTDSPSTKNVEKNVENNEYEASPEGSKEFCHVESFIADDNFREAQNKIDNEEKIHSNSSPNKRFDTTVNLLPQEKQFVGGIIGNSEDVSWQGEHYDVDVYDEVSGNLVSTEHHDNYQWKDRERHMVSERHYFENHHQFQQNGQFTSAVPQNASSFHIHTMNNNICVPSGSVESNPDHDFFRAVAAVVIQTAVRRFLAEIAVLERLYAVEVIQTAIRKWIARKQNSYCNSTDSTTPYQDVQDMFQRKKLMQFTKSVMFEDEIITKSHFFKTHTSNQKYNHAATEIQKRFRGWWVRDGLAVDHYAAATIQRVFRGWWAREAMDVDNYCAVEIQRVIRGYLRRMSYIYDLYCIIVVQSVARRYIAFYKSATRLANILYIQAVYRGYRVRSSLMEYVRNGQEVAATLIQAQWRSYDVRMNYINSLAEILIVQSIARRWLTLRRAKHLKKKNNKVFQYRQPNAQYHWSNFISTEREHLSYEDTNRRPINPVATAIHTSDEFDLFARNSIEEEWYDGNKLDTSDMLRHWRGRKS